VKIKERAGIPALSFILNCCKALSRLKFSSSKKGGKQFSLNLFDTFSGEKSVTSENGFIWRIAAGKGERIC